MVENVTQASQTARGMRIGRGIISVNRAGQEAYLSVVEWPDPKRYEPFMLAHSITAH